MSTTRVERSPLTGLPLPGLFRGRGGLESAMPRVTSSRVEDCRRMRADTQGTSGSAGPPEFGRWPVLDAHARSGCGLPGS